MRGAVCEGIEEDEVLVEIVGLEGGGFEAEVVAVGVEGGGEEAVCPFGRWSAEGSMVDDDAG